jgi:hypothetical protein
VNYCITVIYRCQAFLCYNKAMPDNPDANAVEQSGVTDPPPPPVIEQQAGSSDATEIGQQNVSAKIQDLGDELHKAERWMIGLTGAIAFLGLCTVVVGAFQWSAMKGQLGEMKSGGVDTHAIAEAASDQADAAQQFSDTAEDINNRMSDAVDQLQAAANNANTGIKATQDAMRLEQRAWVAVSGITGTPTLGQQFIVQITAANSGRTFAKRFRMVSTVEVARAGTKLSFENDPEASYNSLSILPPNGTYIAKNKVTGEGSLPALPNPTQDDMDKIKAGNVEISAFDYTDIFKAPHWTIYCFRLQRDMNWISCGEHNDADNNYPSQNPN